MKTILIVEDRQDIRSSLEWLLEDNGYNVRQSESILNGKHTLDKYDIDLVLLDMNFKKDTTNGEEGLEFLRWKKEHNYSVPVVVMTAWKSDFLIVKATKEGAYDFIEKPLDNRRLLQIVKNALNLSSVSKKADSMRLLANCTKTRKYEWKSKNICDVLEGLKSVSKTDVPIFLTGENGTGKSEIAKFIHQNSSVKLGNFVSVNMGGLVSSLFESELFGHKRGAFTDAKEERIGRFEIASKGSLFLDEVANIPIDQQPKILRVLDAHEYEKIGSSTTIAADCRLIFASNANFEELIRLNLFREDLYYRMNVISMQLPPLRDRLEDIRPLADHFLSYFSSKYSRAKPLISDNIENFLRNYTWPGNIREMSNLMSRAVLLGFEDIVEAHAINASEKELEESTFKEMTLDQVEKEHVIKTYNYTNGNIKRMSAVLGRSESSIYRLVKQYCGV